MENGLGIPLPKGSIAFYTNNKSGDIEFIGETLISNKAKEQDLILDIGKNFDVYASGKFNKLEKVSERKYKKNINDNCVTVENLYFYDVVYEVKNTSKYEQNITLKQRVPNNAEIISESLEAVVDENGNRVWKFNVMPDEEYKLNLSVNNVIEFRDCSNKIYLDVE